MQAQGVKPVAFSGKFTVRCWTFLIYVHLSLSMVVFTRQSPSAVFANMEKCSKADSDLKWVCFKLIVFLENPEKIQTIFPFKLL